MAFDDGQPTVYGYVVHRGADFAHTTGHHRDQLPCGIAGPSPYPPLNGPIRSMTEIVSPGRDIFASQVPAATVIFALVPERVWERNAEGSHEAIRA